MGSFHTLKFGLILILTISTILILKQNKFNFRKWKFNGQANNREFTIDFVQNIFLKDNEPFQYISGSIHYSRVPAIYWYDRLLKMKAAGLNAIQIYIPWNFHEYEEGKFDFSGNKDLNAFLTLAKNLDLLVLLRSGPYMCGEWDFGGLPAWLLKNNPHMVLRSSAPDYMAAVSKWYNVLLPILKPHLYQNNGSIIMVQIENEYGSYFTCDNAYLRALYNIVRSFLGDDIIIYSTDGNGLSYLICGSSDRRIFSTVDFGTGSKPESAFSALEIFQPRGPLVNSEYYVGWLDSWGNKFNQVPSTSIVNSLRDLYDYSDSVNVNMYMFHGGTSFGFWNGANALPYLPQITSYDYDAPISEAGDTTLKYLAIRDFIKTIRPNQPVWPVPPNSTKMAYGLVNLQQQTDFLTELLNQSAATYPYPVVMESLNQFQGLMVYFTNTQMFLSNNESSRNGQVYVLEFSRIGDYAFIFTANEDNTQIFYQGTLDRNMPKLSLNINVNVNLIILVENCGHVNYGSYMVNDVKGIVGNVTLNKKVLTNWKHFPIDLTPHEPIISVSPNDTIITAPTQAGFFISMFTIVGQPADTFALFPNFSKGFLIINGFNLGRYWNTKGPQYTLYVPKSVLNSGINYVTVFELEGSNCLTNCYIDLIDYPIMNGPVH